MPTIVDTIGHAVQANDQGVLHQAVLCMYHVLKVQTTKRLLRDKLVFMDSVVPALFMHVAQIWKGHTEALINQLSTQPTQELERAVQIGILLDKCILGMLHSGFRPTKLVAGEAGDALQVVAALLEKLQALLKSPAVGTIEGVGKNAGVLLKWLARVQCAQPLSLLWTPPDSASPLLATIVGVSLTTIGQGTGDANRERLAKAALRILTQTIRQLGNMSNGEERESKREERLFVEAVVSGLLQGDTCRQLLGLTAQ
eukprot:SAG31_NODE_1615_length_7737_cov_5.540848_3_plen_256_part_00